MPSATDPDNPAKPALSRVWGDGLQRWNSRLHYYLGLYLLFFLWLFAFTGLLLNHATWKFAEFWSNRQQTTFERDIVAPAPGSDLARARDLLRQLGIRGEIEWTETHNDPSRFNFRASRPGHICEIKTDLARHRATVQQIDLNLWGVARILHTFSGVRIGEERNQRDWYLTSLWVLAMDAVAAGLVIIVLSSLWMWWKLPHKRLGGALALVMGLLACGWFVFGLRWFY